MDLKRLHKVHYKYPNTERREGKSTYCFDCLLRASRTNYYKNLCYITNTHKASENSLNDFILFLEEKGVIFNYTYQGIIYLNGVKITFMGREVRKIGFDGYFEDYFDEEIPITYAKKTIDDNFNNIRRVLRNKYQHIPQIGF